jgi:hypothetical protein
MIEYDFVPYRAWGIILFESKKDCNRGTCTKLLFYGYNTIFLTFQHDWDILQEPCRLITID